MEGQRILNFNQMHGNAWKCNGDATHLAYCQIVTADSIACFQLCLLS